MNEEQTDNTIFVDNTTLPVTADLAKLSIDVNSSSTKRVLRKRIPKSATSTDVIISNRRCSLKPKKKRVSEMDIDEENIKEYYLNKKINRKKINLETIYEEGDNVSDDIGIHMSAKRFKRMLLFSSTSKVKKRRAKINRIESKVWCDIKKGGILKNYMDTVKLLKENKPFIIDKKFLDKIDGESSSCV